MHNEHAFVTTEQEQKERGSGSSVDSEIDNRRSVSHTMTLKVVCKHFTAV